MRTTPGEKTRKCFLDMLGVFAVYETNLRKERRLSLAGTTSTDGAAKAQGQAKARAEGRYKGRPEDVERNAAIGRMLTSKQSWGEIQSITGCSGPPSRRSDQGRQHIDRSRDRQNPQPGQNNM